MSSPTTPPPGPSIGVILCSSRQPRVCPQIAAFVTETIETRLSSSSPCSSSSSPTEPPQPTLHAIDLLSLNLPLFNEPLIPSQTPSPSSYTHPHTRAWSLEIRSHAAVIFVLPQYNWGYPAVVKNAIDYLYHEWRGKPAMVVSYGGHGGVKAAAQLRQVLRAVGMEVVEAMPALAFPSERVLGLAAKGEALPLGGEEGIWREEREGVWRAFGELMVLVARK